MQESVEKSKSQAPTWLKAVACLALLAGLALGLLALFASIGVWLGWWDFRQGFSLLGIVNSYALWVIAGSLIAAVLVFVVGRNVAGAKAASWSGLALVGTLSAALAYYVPESYRPPEGTPPIHDISTDTNNPPEFVDILPLRADAPNSHVYGDSPNLTAEKLAALQKQAYPDIEPMVFDETQEQVFARALAAADAMGWDIVSHAPEAGRIEATDTTFWFRFKDDVVIRVAANDGKTIVDARSVSRVGTSDVGKNAERLRAFFQKM